MHENGLNADKNVHYIKIKTEEITDINYLREII